MGNHHGEHGVGGDVEGDAEEEVGATLVELAGKFVIVIDVELEHGMTGGEGHLVDFTGVPGADDVSAAMGSVFNAIDDLVDLIDGASFGAAPVGPLGAIDSTEVAVVVSPLVPDVYIVFFEVVDIGIAFKEPEEFVGNAFHVDFFSSQKRKAIGEVVTSLGTKYADSANACAVAALFSVFKYVF